MDQHNASHLQPGDRQPLNYILSSTLAALRDEPCPVGSSPDSVWRRVEPLLVSERTQRARSQNHRPQSTLRVAYCVALLACCVSINAPKRFAMVSLKPTVGALHLLVDARNSEGDDPGAAGLQRLWAGLERARTR